MSILRYDVTTGDWLAYSTARAKRPDGFGGGAPAASTRPGPHDPNCPFCPGRESSTPPACDVEPDPSDPSRWSVRIVPNKFPALDPSASLERRHNGPLFREMDGHGRHELVVESPDHDRYLWEQPLEQVERLVHSLARRAKTLAADPELEVVQIFKNHGSRAGSSMPHPHLQIVATPIVPRLIRTKYHTAADYYNATGVSLYTELCRAELDAGERIVCVNEEFVAFAPYASRSPYETWIVPRRASSTFYDADPATLAALPSLLLDVLGRLARALGPPPFNLLIHSAPRRHADEPDFVWHIEILPRLATAAGFELATGMTINAVLPEDAARTLREA